MSGSTGWRKSSASLGNQACAEVGSWRKSTGSEAGNCVEAADGNLAVLVRDTTDRGGTMLVFPAGAWAEFTARVAGGS